MWCHSTLVSPGHFCAAFDFNSVSLLLTTMQRYPRVLAMVSSSRATRRPESETSTTQRKYSRLQPSMTQSIQNRRPLDRLSKIKSSGHLWFGPCGIAIGARFPMLASNHSTRFSKPQQPLSKLFAVRRRQLQPPSEFNVHRFDRSP